MLGLFHTAVAQAQNMDKAKSVINRVEKAIIDPLILLAFAVAIVVFFYGIVKFINNTDNPTEKEVGKKNMIYGIVGLTIMISVYGILEIIASTVGNSSLVL